MQVNKRNTRVRWQLLPVLMALAITEMDGLVGEGLGWVRGWEMKAGDDGC